MKNSLFDIFRLVHTNKQDNNFYILTQKNTPQFFFGGLHIFLAIALNEGKDRHYFLGECPKIGFFTHGFFQADSVCLLFKSLTCFAQSLFCFLWGDNLKSSKATSCIIPNFNSIHQKKMLVLLNLAFAAFHLNWR